METASKRRFARDGFTIVELLIVILLVSVILVFAVPSLVNLSPSRKANIAEMLAYLEKARAQAIANQRDVYVCFVDDNFPETDYRFRAMGVFKSGSLTEEGNPVDTRELEQQDRTFFLPVGLVFADKSDLEKQGRAGNEQTVLMEIQRMAGKFFLGIRIRILVS